MDSETACLQLGCGHRDCLLAAAGQCEVQKKNEKLTCYISLGNGNDAVGKGAKFAPKVDPAAGPEIIADLSATGMIPHIVYRDIPSPGFWTAALDELHASNALDPNINAYVCIEVDITLPGVQLQFGLNGGMALDTGSGCWTLTFEGSIGVFFGLKVFGLAMGVNIHVAGTFSMEEVPGDDGQCVATSNPFTIITETVETLKTSLSKDERVQAQIEKSLAKVRTSAAYTGFDDYKPDSLQAMKVEASPNADAYGVVQDKLLRRSIVAVYMSWPWVEEKIMRYAAQVLDMLVDVGPGVDPTQYYAKEGAGVLGGLKETVSKTEPINYKQNTGRFLARRLSSVTTQQKVQADKDQTKINIFDDRVHNFPASIRESEWAGNPYFWREYAISGANLFIRAVKDVQAVFNAYVFGQAEWDGDCESLPAKFYPVKEKKAGVPSKKTDGTSIDTDGESPFADHHWASPFMADSLNLDSGKKTAAFWKTSGLKSLKGVQDAIYPHVICQSFKISAEDLKSDKDLLNSAKNSSKTCKKEFDKPVPCKTPTECNSRGGPGAVECSSSLCVCKAGFCARSDTCVPSGRTKPFGFANEKGFFSAFEEKEMHYEGGTHWDTAGHSGTFGVELSFPKARDVILGGEKVSHLEYETVMLNGVFITAFPQFVVRMMEIYVKISEELDKIDDALCEQYVSDSDFEKQVNEATTKEQLDKLFGKIAHHLPARLQHQFATLRKKSEELSSTGGIAKTALQPNTAASKQRFRHRRRQADGHASGNDPADPGTGGTFPTPQTECEGGGAPNPIGVSTSAISIVDHVRTLLLQLSANDFGNAESIWKGETPDSQGVKEAKRWYGRMSAQPAPLPNKGQTHMPALLLTALKEHVPLVPQMREDWATAFKVESAGKKCCVKSKMSMPLNECGIFEESTPCPAESRSQRNSAMGDLGNIKAAAEGGCCGTKQWAKIDAMSGQCEVMGCLVDNIQPNGLGGEKLLLMGTHFQGILKALKLMQENVEWYKTTMEDEARGKIKNKIANAVRAPIVQYTASITLDIESSPPGFCTPSSSLLQVVGSISWSGMTDSKKPMTRQACISARVAPSDFYFMLTFCLQTEYDPEDAAAGGLNSIDDGKNGVQVVSKHSTYKVTINSFSYLAKAAPLNPDPKLAGFLEPLKNLFFAGGPSAIAGALTSSGASMSMPSVSQGLMKIAMAAPTVGVTSALMMDPSPLESLGSAIGAMGMALSTITIFVQGMMAKVASGGLENAADFLKINPKDYKVTPISLDMELVSDTSVEFELTWRACRFNELNANIRACDASRGEGEVCSDEEKAAMKAKCTRLVRPLKKTAELHIASWNRLAVTFVSPVPGGAAKIQPLFGLEVDFNFTPLWELMENHNRFKFNEKRQQACSACLTRSSQHATFMVSGLKTQDDVLKGKISETLMQKAIATSLKIETSKVQVYFKEFQAPEAKVQTGPTCCVQRHYWNDKTFIPAPTQTCSTGPWKTGEEHWLEFNPDKLSGLNDFTAKKVCCTAKLLAAAAKGVAVEGKAQDSGCSREAREQRALTPVSNALYEVSITGLSSTATVATDLIQKAITESFANVEWRADKWVMGKFYEDMAFCDSRYTLTNWKQGRDDQCRDRGDLGEYACAKDQLYGSQLPNDFLRNHIIDENSPPVWIDLTSPELCNQISYKKANSDAFAVDWDAKSLQW